MLWHQFLLLFLMKMLLGHKTPVSITSDEEASMTDTSTV